MQTVSALLGEYRANYVDMHPQVGIFMTAQGLLVFVTWEFNQNSYYMC